MVMKFVILVSLLFVGCDGAKTLLVSFDGFRWDYLNMYRENTTWFHYLRDRGAGSTDGSMTGTFASFTFPSHFTIATGLFQESHGIVANKMYDPLYGYFDVANASAQRDPFWWREATPIWIVSTKQRVPSATFFWPGSETSYDNVVQKYFKYYNKSIPFKQRVDTVVDWLSKDIDFSTLYFDQPDSAGHIGGPYSSLVHNAVAEVNEVLGYLIQKLKDSNLFDKTNLIVLSDHGMAECRKDTIIELYKYVEARTDLYSKMINFLGPVVDFEPQENKEEELYDFLHNLTVHGLVSNVTFYRKEDIPERFHYRNNRRIQKIIGVADLGYFIAAKKVPIAVPAKFGAHGYDNSYPEMRPIFIAHGPGIVAKKRVERFRQVDVYNLLARLINVQPYANNGTWKNISPIFNPNAIGAATTFSAFSLWPLLLLVRLLIE